MAEIIESKNFINLGVVFNKNNEVLMIRRAKQETGRDGSVLTWAFPGGKQRLDETREDCLRREILAETGYAIKPAGKISLRVHPQFSVTVVYHLCYLEQEKPVAEPTEPHEVAEVKWVKPQDVPKLITTDLDPGVKRQLRI